MAAVHRPGAALALALILGCGGCGPPVIWSGRTPDRRHAVEVVQDGGLDHVVVDGVRRATYRGIVGGSITVSGTVSGPASRTASGPVSGGAVGGHLAFVARAGAKWVVVADGQAGEPWDAVDQLVLSPAGRPAYIARRAGRVHAVVGGVAGAAFDDIADLVLSDDGAHVAYAAADGAKWHVVVDGEIGPAVDRVRRIALLGSDVAWVGRIADHDVLVLDGEPVAEAPMLRADAVALSTWGLAYVERIGPGERVIAADTAGAVFDEVGAPVWSADGRIAYPARRGAAWILVVDNRELEGGDWVGAPVFSADARRLAYVVRRGRAWLVIADGRERPFDRVIAGSLAFSRDGKRWAAIAGDAAHDQLFVAIEGRDRVPLPGRELSEAIARRDPDSDRLLRAWVEAELDR